MSTLLPQIEKSCHSDLTHGFPTSVKNPLPTKQPLAFLNLQLSDLTRNSKTDLKQKESKPTNKQASNLSLYPQLPCSS